jgi:hypothetical protein
MSTRETFVWKGTWLHDDEVDATSRLPIAVAVVLGSYEEDATLLFHYGLSRMPCFFAVALHFAFAVGR